MAKEVISEEQARANMNELCVLDARKRILRSELFGYVRANGGISEAGLHCFNQQTTGYCYDADMVADALEELLFGNARESKRKWNESDVLTVTTKVHEVIFYLLNCIVNATMKSKVVENGEYSEFTQAFLGRAGQDPHGQGGMRTYNGDASLDTKEKPPMAGEHHVIGPGEKALEKFPQPERAEEEQE